METEPKFKIICGLISGRGWEGQRAEREEGNRRGCGEEKGTFLPHSYISILLPCWEVLGRERESSLYYIIASFQEDSG